jgi:membrane glycosyltransferase
LSGLWVHIGVDPGSIVAQWLEQILLTVSPENAPWITLAFLYGPTLLTVLSLFFVYRHAGFFGFIAVALAYAAGIVLSFLSIPLLLLAIVIGWLAARRV